MLRVASLIEAGGYLVGALVRCVVFTILDAFDADWRFR
jgi:hypothetical protein